MDKRKVVAVVLIAVAAMESEDGFVRQCIQRRKLFGFEFFDFYGRV